jgi:hypothetical protein
MHLGHIAEFQTHPIKYLTREKIREENEERRLFYHPDHPKIIQTQLHIPCFPQKVFPPISTHLNQIKILSPWERPY